MSGKTNLIIAFKALGLDSFSTVTEQDVNKAYRKQAMLSHPDKHPNDPSATARFQAIQDAHEQVKRHVKSFGGQGHTGGVGRSEFVATGAGGNQEKYAKQHKEEQNKEHNTTKQRTDENLAKQRTESWVANNAREADSPKPSASPSTYTSFWKYLFSRPAPPAKPDNFQGTKDKDKEHDPWDWSISRNQKVYKSPYPAGSMGDELFKHILNSASFWVGSNAGDDEMWMKTVLTGLLAEHVEIVYKWSEKGELYSSFRNRVHVEGKVILNRFLMLRDRRTGGYRG